jgi:NADPH-dependent 2,4-dienoyl-CoA reductase/sulfur reductase-like enzyme/rhodanese-related sulfurtransferase
MKLVVIGAVAAGTSAAAKVRRNDDYAEITIYEKDYDISYSGCGMPYFIGGEIENIEDLVPRDSSFFKKKYNIDLLTRHEVLSVDKNKKKLKVKNLETGIISEDTYDKLVIATGAKPFVPPIKGIYNSNVFFLRNIQNAIAIKNFIADKKPKDVVIAGTGFIGLEVLENLTNLGIKTTIVEIANKITPNLDEDMAQVLEKELIKKGVNLIKGTGISEIIGNNAILGDGRSLKTEMIIMATGVRPNVNIAKEMGVELGVTGAIKVNESMETNIPDVYACGDCIETFLTLNGQPVYRPLGSTANKTGRIAGDVLSGGDMKYRGNMSTGIFKIFDLSVASTGLSEKDALKQGYDIEIIHNIKPDKPGYFHGELMTIKAIADRKTHTLLGVQIIGKEGVDKRIDVFVTLMTYKIPVEDFFHLDLAYAPPFSTTKDPVHYTGMILDNALNKNRKIMTSDEIRKKSESIQIVDARTKKDYENKGCVENAVNIPHAELRERCSELEKNIPTVTYCNKGTTGNAAQNILLNRGFKEVYNLSGGHTFYKATE